MGNNGQKLKYYFKAKKFQFHNNYYTFYRKHNCLRMMDFEIAAYDPNVAKELDIVTFIHRNQYEDEENVVGTDPKRQSTSRHVRNRDDRRELNRNANKIIRWADIKSLMKGIGRR